MEKRTRVKDPRTKVLLDNIKRLQAEKGLNNSELSRRIGRQHDYMKKIMSQGSLPNFLTGLDIAEQLDATISDLLGVDESPALIEVVELLKSADPADLDYYRKLIRLGFPRKDAKI